MANNIDTTTLTALITEFRRLQAKDSVTPEFLGAILQRIADLLATAGTSEIARTVSNWFNNMRNAEPYIAGLNQSTLDAQQVLLTPTLVNPILGQSYNGNVPVSIQSATTSNAGAMSAQQVTDLNTLITNYAVTVTPAIKDVNTLNQCMGVLFINKINDLDYIDYHVGRIIKVRNSMGFSDGYIMHITCHLFVTQIFFTHCSIDVNGQLNANHDEMGFHIYKRYKSLSDDDAAWSPWELVGGDEFADVKQRVDSLLGTSDGVSTLSAKGQIDVEIVDNKLRIYGSSQLAMAGYVPYLFRHTRKRNRDNVHKINGLPSYGAPCKGWHLFGSRHSINVSRTIASFSTNPSKKFHEPALGYTYDPIALVHPKYKSNGNIAIPWGRSIIEVFDRRADQNRMVRLRFAVGYAKPIDHGAAKLNVLNLVSNLAEFSVIFDPTRNTFSLSR